VRLAVLVFDNRGWGESGVASGRPQHEIDPWEQIRDYQHAITHAQKRIEVDADRVGVWGTSFSGPTLGDPPHLNKLGAPGTCRSAAWSVRRDRPTSASMTALTLEGGATRMFQAGVLRLSLNGEPVRVDDGEAASLSDPVINLAEAMIWSTSRCHLSRIGHRRRIAWFHNVTRRS
jgi:hypothetical protein